MRNGKRKHLKFRVLWAIIVEVFVEITNTITYAIKCNFRHLATLISIATPYVMYVLGYMLYIERGYFAWGGELFIPFFSWLLCHLISGIANRLHKGNAIPRPRERFTVVDEDDDIISVPDDKVDEMLVYLADLEDWMERKGWL